MALPDLNLAHLRLMTDSTGLLQHARFSVPRYDEGYCVDDNARALLLMTLLEQTAPDRASLGPLASRYLAFVNHAFNPAEGRFRNFMGYSRTWLESRGSDDSHGRTTWALGATAGQCRDQGRRALAEQLFHAGLPAALEFTNPRSWAYALLGINAYLAAFPGDARVVPLEADLAGRLHGLYLAHGDEGWPWFEDRLTYCNARLPQALLLAGARSGRQDWVDAGLRSLDWLARIQTGPEGRFTPIGSNGFFIRGRSRAGFDQQPVEACATVAACLDAGAVSGDAEWERRARIAFDWFLGRNQLDLPLYDPHTGGCRDGLHAHAANENLGAESTLSFLLALVAMRKSLSR
jgi:hypothetical protein